MSETVPTFGTGALIPVTRHKDISYVSYEYFAKVVAEKDQQIKILQKLVDEQRQVARRDYFAASALNGLLVNNANERDRPFFVKASIAYADAMIAALDSKQEGGAT